MVSSPSAADSTGNQSGCKALICPTPNEYASADNAHYVKLYGLITMTLRYVLGFPSIPLRRYGDEMEQTP